MEQWSFILEEQAESSPLNTGQCLLTYNVSLLQQWHCNEIQVQKFSISLTSTTEMMKAPDNNHLPIP